MKKILSITLLNLTLFSFAQEADSTKTKLKFFGSFENNGQWYTNDKPRDIKHDPIPLRSNNYLNLNLNYGKFTVGTQVESYTKEALLNYNPKYTGTNFGTYYANYKSKKLDITAGHYYVQFGSGMALRAWEDRPLGINNALRGAKIVFTPNDNIAITGLYGKTRTGFDVANSDIFGFNSDLFLSKLIGFESFDFKYGFSAVSKYEKAPENNIYYKDFTNMFSNRFEFGFGNYYLNTEYVFKTDDAVVEAGTITDLEYPLFKEGSALLINFGYSKKGFGIDANLRRVENMLFLAERQPTQYADSKSNSLNFNDKILNFVPSLTKQHHSNLANIYVYQAQYQILLSQELRLNKTGEIGGEIDIFYEFKKGSLFGGKYGTKVNLNLSSWHNLKNKARYTNSLGQPDKNYKSEFFIISDKYFSDYNIEITKKLSPKFKTSLTYINLSYNNRLIQGVNNKFIINSHIVFSESSIQLSKSKSLTFGLEHMWSDNDRRNWMGGNLEYSHNEHWSLYAIDMFNYGYDESVARHTNTGILTDDDPKTNLINETDLFDIHYYNFGIAYKRSSTRIALGYGRQRGGLVCAGGVCRFVPPSSGLNLQITSSF